VSSGEYNFRPNGPNQQWHTDVYVWVAARFYFLLSFVDAYSRYIVHHKLLISLDGQSVAVELQAALEAVKDGQTPGCATITAASSSSRCRRGHSRPTTDRHQDQATASGNQMASSSASMARCAMKATTTIGDNYLQAEADHCQAHAALQRRAITCDSRLHDAGDWHRGQPDDVRDERARRIAAARAHRRMTNQQRFTEAA